ncbi:MAG: HD domain-containing protein [Bdellovibrionales bacterium]|nr:HD domain-containing protein [Bdellovibrionales bacterium]
MIGDGDGNNNSKMIPVPIRELIDGVKTPVDLYIRLNDTKFIQIAKAGSCTEKKRLSNYKDKEISYLWIKGGEFHLMTQMNVAIAGIIVKKENLNTRQKVHVVSAAANSVFKELNHLGITVGSYGAARQVTEVTVSLVESHNDLAQLFHSLNECSQPLMRHSMAVSILSVLIGINMGWEQKSTLEKLSLGGLLHDIGKKALPPDLLEKSLASMTYDEIQLYESHPYKGMMMLQGLGVVPDDVVSIVLQHHENALGQGFPQKLRNLKTHPLAKVVALANEFVNLTVKSHKHPHPVNPREALLLIEHTMGQPYNKEVFDALSKVIDKKVNAA